MSASVLLVNPWIYDFAAYDLWVRPLGLLGMAAALRSCGLDVQFLDCLDRSVAEGSGLPARQKPRSDAYGCGHFRYEFMPRPAVLEAVNRRWKRYGVPTAFFELRLAAAPRPAAVLVGCTMTYWYPGVFEVIRRVKERWPGVPVLLGGVYAKLCPEHAARRSGADCVVAGGGLADAMSAVGGLIGQPLHPPDGLTEDEPLCPDYGLIRHFGAAAVLTSRGCPYRCSYCASRLLAARRVRFRPEAVADVIEQLVGRYGIQDVAFYDDALLLDAERHLLPILDLMARRDISVRLHAPNGLHPRYVTAAVAQALRRAGFVTLRLSYESTGADRQERSDGKVTTEELANALRTLRDVGFAPGQMKVYALMGLPGQREEEVAATLVTIHELGGQSSLAEFSPVPGTEEFERWDHPNRELARDEPLLHNNTAFPYVAGPGCLTADAYRRLQELSRSLNKSVEAALR
jgi:radical SAM superfamily enzyme YgiQ (UPF0313 family)